MIFRFFSKNFAPRKSVYWHDTRSRADQGKLRPHPAREFLGSLADRLAGFHIHDVHFPTLDHCAPGTGMIDYAALKPFVKPEHVKVFEFSNRIPVEAARDGIAHMKKIWGGE